MGCIVLNIRLCDVLDGTRPKTGDRAIAVESPAVSLGFLRLVVPSYNMYRYGYERAEGLGKADVLGSNFAFL